MSVSNTRRANQPGNWEIVEIKIIGVTPLIVNNFERFRTCGGNNVKFLPFKKAKEICDNFNKSISDGRK